jgi:hypothetical protein
MAYRVEFPPDIEKDEEISSGLSLPKNSGKSGKDGNDNQPAGNLLEAVKDIFSINRPCRSELVVRQVAPYPIGPVDVASDSSIFGPPDHQVRSTIAVPYLTILDPAKFVSATLADLASYVSAKNQGRHHSWIEDIIDERIEQLRLCGVEAEIRTVQ